MSSTGEPGRNDVYDLSQTLSVFDDDLRGRPSRFASHLVFVLCADRLPEPSRRILVDGELKTVAWGRRPELSVRREDGLLEVGVPDPRMSSKHARLVRAGGGWCIEDLGSKNGSLVNGEPVRGQRRIDDGDLLELGHSFFVFRDPGPTWPGDDDHAQVLPGTPLETLHGPLAERFSELRRVAPSDLPLTLLGESGSGKEVVARAAHTLSKRTGPFVAVNCGALPETLVESELFGAKRGAFSGADADRTGLIEAAHGGTLFLDEIAELPASAQAKLLRALQERCVTPVGSTETIAVDFRLLSATHQDLATRVEVGTFRGDLYSRIGGFSLELPPLRARREDLGLLIRRFLAAGGGDLEKLSMGRTLARRLLLHPWPYNVRELEKAIGVALTLAEHGVLSANHLDLTPASPPDAGDSALTPEDLDRREQLVALLVEHDGNVSQVARAMGKARMQIHRWMKRYDIDPKRPL